MPFPGCSWEEIHNDYGAVPPRDFEMPCHPLWVPPGCCWFTSRRSLPPPSWLARVSSPGPPNKLFWSLISGAVYTPYKNTPAVRAPVSWQALRLAGCPWAGWRELLQINSGRMGSPSGRSRDRGSRADSFFTAHPESVHRCCRPYSFVQCSVCVLCCPYFGFCPATLDTRE